jgi:hypothetical protein
MLHLCPQATSWASRLLGITDLEIRPYRWSVVTETGKWRGEFTVEYLAHGASLHIDAVRYRMQRRSRGLRQTKFTRMAASGEELASARQRVRGLMTRETTMRVAGKACTLSGGREQLTLLSADNRAAGWLQIELSGWTVARLSALRRQLNRRVGAGLCVLDIDPSGSHGQRRQADEPDCR